MTNARKFSSLADFTKVGQEIANQVEGYKALLQTATIAAFVHLDKHGNYNVIKPLWDAATGFSKGEGRKWLDYVTSFTHLTYNPKGLRGQALADATFESLWAKDKGKAMNIDGARKVNWFDHKRERANSDKPVSLSKQVATMIKSLQGLLMENRLVITTPDGKGVARKATAADVRSELKHQLETIVTQLKAIDGGKSKGVGTRNPSTVENRKPETATPVQSAKSVGKAKATTTKRKAA